jgi:Amt family ammonium transporter
LWHQQRRCWESDSDGFTVEEAACARLPRSIGRLGARDADAIDDADLIIGLIAGFAGLWGVNGLKKMLGADDSLDVFGVHGVCGILGALLTGVFNSPSLGGPGYVADWVTATMVTAADYSILGQVWIQLKAVLITLVWSGVVSVIAFKIVDMTIGLRVSEEQEREGLDISSHGETAYNR